MATSKDRDKSKASPATSASASSAALGDEIRAGGAVNTLMLRAGIVGVVGIAASVGLGMLEDDNYRRFSHSYLTAYMWALAIGTGVVFWVTLQNLVNAKWSVALRRLGELMASSIPLLGLLALPLVVPVLMGSDTLFPWANHAKVEADHMLHHKAAYLNPGFFAVRVLVYFATWTLLARYFLKRSLEQDKTGAAANIAQRMQRLAGPGMILFGLTVTFFSVDFLMSLDPYWFSTIFGVYYFASAVLCANSSLVLAAMWLQSHGTLKKSVTVEHFHDLGKMMFAFTVFWAYIGFSQFMLIWYANIPEETAWYKERLAGDWATVSTLLVILHFVIPFFGLLSRHVKRSRRALAFWAIWILAVVYLDMYWLVMPSLKLEHVPFALIDITCWVGLAGALVAAMAFSAKNMNLVAVNDPRLPKSLAFENI